MNKMFNVNPGYNSVTDVEKECGLQYWEVVQDMDHKITWIWNCNRFANNCFPMIAASKYRSIRYFDWPLYKYWDPYMYAY